MPSMSLLLSSQISTKLAPRPPGSLLGDCWVRGSSGLVMVCWTGGMPFQSFFNFRVARTSSEIVGSVSWPNLFAEASFVLNQ